jgi:hypothetical protein
MSFNSSRLYNEHTTLISSLEDRIKALEKAISFLITHIDSIDDIISGKMYLVNFINPERFFNNNPMPAIVTKRKKNNTVSVVWTNGFSCVIDFKYLNVSKRI